MKVQQKWNMHMIVKIILHLTTENYQKSSTQLNAIMRKSCRIFWDNV